MIRHGFARIVTSWIALPVLVYGFLDQAAMGAPLSESDFTLIPTKIVATAPTPIAVEFKVPLDELSKRVPQTMMLYRAGLDRKATEQAKAVGEILGKGSHVEVSKQSGGIFTADLTRLWAELPAMATEVKAMEESAVHASAEKFLGKIKGLPGNQATVQRVTFDMMETHEREGRRNQLPMAANITYRRVFPGGYEGVGPGGKLKVFHDLRGNVAGYLRVWRNLTPTSRGGEPLISLDEAVTRFKRNPLGRVMLAGVTRVEVLDMRPAYLELGLTDVQNYVQPVFVFDCMAYVKQGEGETKVPYVRYLEALAKLPEPLWPVGQVNKSPERSGVMPKVEVGDD